jgi:VCBS repeat-containing protein
LTGAFEDTPFNITYAMLAEACDEADAENNTLSFSIISVSTGGLNAEPNTLLAAGESVTWMPASQAHGTVEAFVVKAYDGFAYSSTPVAVQVQVQSVNDTPVAVDDEASVGEGTQVLLEVLVNDTDADGDVLEVDIVSAPTHGEVDVQPDGTVLYTHNGDESSLDSFSYTVSDGTVSSNTAEVVLSIVHGNDAPVMTSVSSFENAVEDTAYTLTYADMLSASNAADAENDVLAFKVIEVKNGVLTHNNTPVVEGSTLLQTASQWIWTPPTNVFGLIEAFTVKAWDGVLGSLMPVSVYVQVQSVNDTPQALNDTAEVDEASSVNIAVLTNDTDVETLVLQHVSHTQPTHGSLVLNSDNTFTYQHDGSETTSDSFTYTLSDGVSSSNEASVSIVVRPVNDAPTLTALNRLTGAEEDKPYVVSYAALRTASDMEDVDSALLWFQWDEVTSGTLTRNGNPVLPSSRLGVGEAWVWTPPLNAKGTLNAFKIKAWDGEALSNTAVQVRVQAASVNDTPTCAEGEVLLANAHEDTPYTFTYSQLLSAVHAEDIDGNPLALKWIETYSGVLNTQNRVLLAPGGTWTWTPAKDVFGEVLAFAVKVTDGVASSQATTLVKIQVENSPDAPVLTQIEVLQNAIEDTPYSISYASLASASNIQDVDGEPASFVVAQVGEGVLSLNNTPVQVGDVLSPGQTWVWMAPNNASGTLTAVVVRAKDNEGVSGQNIPVRVQVNSVNDVPLAVNDTVRLAKGASVQVDVLRNDTDAEQTPLQVTSLSQPLYGVVEVLSNHHVRYTHDGSSSTQDSFTYRASDGVGLSQEAAVLITLAPNEPPVWGVMPVFANAFEDTGYVLTHTQLLQASGAQDVENASLVFVFNPPVQGVERLNAGESFTWQPAANVFGEMEVTRVRVFDGELYALQEQPLRVQVQAVNDVPVMQALEKRTLKYPSSAQSVQVEVVDVEDVKETIDVVAMDVGLRINTAKVHVETDGHVLHVDALGWPGETYVRVIATDTEGGFSEQFMRVEVQCLYGTQEDGRCGSGEGSSVSGNGQTNNADANNSSSQTDTVVTTQGRNTRAVSCQSMDACSLMWLVWGVLLRFLRMKKINQ